MTREQFISHVEGTQKSFRRFLVALCCGNTMMADDIAQDSYMKAYLSFEKFNGNENFKAWIYKIGFNTFVDNKRSDKVHGEYNEAANLVSDESADSAFRYQALYAALNLLPAKERTSVLLYYMEGYSIKEIAGIVNNSEDAIKKHLSRGRSHLRDLLK